MPTCYRIKNWNDIYENNRSREIDQTTWIVMPNNFDSDGYTMIMDEKDGVEIFGCWVSVAKLASKCRPRGVLVRSEGDPHDSFSISRITRIPEKKIARMIDFCINNCKWLEIIDSQSGAVLPQEGATPPQEGAASRAHARTRGMERMNGKKEGNEGSGAVAPSVPSVLIEEKKKHLDFVFLTDDQYSRLRIEFGIKFLDACIFRLNAYLANNEKKRRQYKDHNLVIRSWVKDEVEKKIQPRPEPEKPFAPGPPPPLTAEDKVAAEEGMRIFQEQTQRILKHVSVMEENTK